MRKITVLLLCLMLAMGGCASKYGTQITKVKHYPDCYSPIAELRKAERDFNRRIAGGVFLGALAGAVTGLAASDGKSEGAIVGALAGAAAGGIGGYAAAKYAEHKDDEERFNSYLDDMDADMEGATSVELAANHARKCYAERFDEARREYKAKLISRSEFQEKFTEIKNGLTETSRILGKTAETLAEKQDIYQAAISDEASRKGQNVPVARKPAKAKPGKGKKPKAGSKQPTPTKTAGKGDPTLQGLADKSEQIKAKHAEAKRAQEEVDSTVVLFEKNAQDLLGEGA